MNRRDMMSLLSLAPLFGLVKPPVAEATPRELNLVMSEFYGDMITEATLSPNDCRSLEEHCLHISMSAVLWCPVAHSLPPLDELRACFWNAPDGSPQRLWRKVSAPILIVAGATVYFGHRTEDAIDGSEWVSGNYYVFGVTHWAELPSPPSEA